jgi:hypothetical protein
MSSISEVPFHPGHIMLLGLSPEDMRWIKNPMDTFAKQAASGVSTTILIDGRVAFCGGVTKVWPGVGEAWLMSSDLARRNPLLLTKTARRFIASAMDALALHRVQCFVDTSDQRAVRWPPALGFQHEGTLRRYGFDGSDHEAFSIVR